MDAVSYSHSAKQAQRIEKIVANPDSTDGVVTVPSVIGSTETINIPAGRTAVLPNVTVEGTLVVDGEVFVPSGSTFGDLGDQIALKANIADVYNKTEVGSSLALKANTLDLKEIGVDQSWQDVTASRTRSVTYTNNTGRPIQLAIGMYYSTSTKWVDLYIDGTMYFRDILNQGASIFAIIPDGSTYRFESETVDVIQKWSELR